jgi:hypothetical protein
MRPRGSRRARLRFLTLSIAVLGVLALAAPVGASAGVRALYASGHPFDTARFAQFGGNTVVDPGDGRTPSQGFDGCSDSAWASALARTDYDVLIVGEDAPDCFTSDLSSTTLTNIANFVRSGHRYIQTGAHEEQDEFMNTVFGFSTADNGSSSDESLSATLQSGATGTPFAGGPSAVHAVDATDFMNSTPGTTIYSGPEGTWVFTVPFGAGSVTYLAWDLCGQLDGCGTDFTLQDDWYRVLDRADQVANAFTVDSITRNKKKGTATITGSADFAGDLSASGNGAKVASAGAVISKAVGAGQTQLVVKAKGKKRKKLNRKGKVKLNIAITYTATGGSPTTQSVKVKLKKKHKKK